MILVLSVELFDISLVILPPTVSEFPIWFGVGLVRILCVKLPLSIARMMREYWVRCEEHTHTHTHKTNVHTSASALKRF